MLTRNLQWQWFNALTFAVEDKEELPEAIKMLENMRALAYDYIAASPDGWTPHLGLYVHSWPVCSVNAFSLHLVDEGEGECCNLCDSHRLARATQDHASTQEK